MSQDESLGFTKASYLLSQGGRGGRGGKQFSDRWDSDEAFLTLNNLF